MSLINNFFILTFSKKVGKDQYGNRYYESKKHDYLGRARRQVIYKGKVDASKVPPMWHAWLHYMVSELPNEDNKFPWQQDYFHNVSSTNYSTKAVDTNISKQKYNRWKP